MREQRSRATNSKHCLETSGTQARTVCSSGFPAARVPLGLFIEMPPLPVAVRVEWLPGMTYQG
jgi:hypothetical protein